MTVLLDFNFSIVRISIIIIDTQTKYIQNIQTNIVNYFYTTNLHRSIIYNVVEMYSYLNIVYIYK